LLFSQRLSQTAVASGYGRQENKKFATVKVVEIVKKVEVG